MGDNKESKFVFSINKSVDTKPDEQEDYSLLSFLDVDACFLALTSEEYFLRFKEIIDEDFYGDSLELIDSFKKLVYVLRNAGYRFSDEEKKRVFLLTNINISNMEDISDSLELEANTLYTYLKIICDPEFYKTYLSLGEDAYINGICKKYCEENIISELRKYKIFINNFSSNVSSVLTRFSLLGMLREGDYAYTPDIVTLDSDVERKIMSDFPSYIVDDEDKAKEIYHRLNNFCELIPRQYTEGFSDESLCSQLGSLSSSDMTLNKPGVTCSAWADLYWQLLNKYTNLKCFICGKKDFILSHKYVVILPSDGRCLSADGTSIIYDKRNKTKMCDITREKLGLSLANFGSYEKLKKENRFSFSDDLDDTYDHDMEVYRITQLIGSLEAKKMLQDAFDGDVADLLFGKFKVICQIIYDNRDIDNVSLHSLSKNLLHICFNASERETITYNDFYTKELSDYPFVICFSTQLMDNQYVHYLLDINDGFHKLTTDELSSLIATGRLIKVDSNDKIMGIDNYQY